MSLRILEDKRRFTFHRLSPSERDKIIKALAKALSGRGEVVLAVVFGGFVESEVFRDVDVAVFTGYTVPYDRVEVFEEELSRYLESIVGLPVDVRVIDYAPSWFRVRALNGVVLVEKEPALAARLKFKSWQEVNDFKVKLRKVSLKTLMRSS